MISAATRHFGDVMVGFGLPSQSWNARDAYRTKYSDSDRLGAGLGTAAAVAVPAFTLARSFKGEGMLANKLGQSFRNTAYEALKAADPDAARSIADGVVARRPGWQTNIGRAYVAGVGAIGAAKLYQVAQDDGHWGAAGAAAGIVGGAMAGWNLVGNAMRGKPYAPIAVPLIGTALAIGGGFAGHMAGSRITAGTPGQRNTSHADSYVTTGGSNVLGKVADGGRGFWTHFVEGGPLSPGFSMDKWGQDRHFKNEAGPSERNGGLSGDAAATGVIAAGALTAGAGIVLPTLSNTLSRGLVDNVSGLTHQGMAMAEGLNPQNIASGQRAIKGTMYAAAAIPAAYAIANSGVVGGFNKWRETGDAGDMIQGAAVLGAGAVGAAAFARAASRSEAFQRMAPGTQIPAGVFTGVLVMSALMGARKPGQQLFSDFNVARKDGGVDIARAGINAVPAAAMGAVLGTKIGARLGGKGTLIGGIAGGLVGAAGGTALSVGQKDTVKSAAGAAAGAALTMAVVNRGAILKGPGGGARLAMMAAGGMLAGAAISGSV